MSSNEEVTYDRYGRMNYHPDFHGKHKTPWTTTDQQFLIDNYEAMGPENISFALERTIHTVMTRVYFLRRRGLMPPALPAGKRKTHRRTYGERKVVNA